MTWHRIDVAYHDPACDHVILDAVWPLFSRISDVARRRYLVRHWLRGPHLELHIDCPDTAIEPVWDEANDVIGEYLRRHPSRHAVDPDRLLALHEHLAAAERVDEPLTPLYPDNTLHRVRPRSRVHVLGSRRAEELLSDFHASATGPAFDALEEVRRGESRLAVGLDLVLAATHAFADGTIADGFVSLRSHAEAFLANLTDPDRTRASWNRQYARLADMLRARVRAVTGAVDGDHTLAPAAAGWVGLLREYEHAGKELIDGGLLTFGDEQAAGEPDTSFHRALRENDRWDEVERSTPFRTFRLLLNFTYLQLSRLGVTGIERSLLCHLAADAVEDEFGVSALDIVARRQAHPPVGAGGR